MKKILLIAAVFTWFNSMAQDTQLKSPPLAVPTSPAFIITDITPTLVQSPNTPKAFVLGVAQSYQQSGSSFPDNYAAELAPYWWLKPGQMDVFDVQGIKTIKDSAGRIMAFGKENPFAGLRFTSLSVAFINKDLIPDTSKLTQKVFSLGIRTTLIKAHRAGYASDLSKALQQWHDATIRNFRNNPKIQAALARCDTQAQQDSVLKKYQSILLPASLETINSLLSQKPIFSWDFAAAYAVYGINDQVWKNGRTGVWTTLSTYLPLNLTNTNQAPTSYFNLNVLARYQSDQFYQTAPGVIGTNHSLDLGGNATLEFKQLSVGVESLYRFNNGKANDQNRTVGVINFKLADNIVLNGTFGRNFDVPGKLIAALGVNWGIGKENIKLPEAGQ
jgi:hypothetical protein